MSEQTTKVGPFYLRFDKATEVLHIDDDEDKSNYLSLSLNSVKSLSNLDNRDLVVAVASPLGTEFHVIRDAHLAKLVRRHFEMHTT